MGAVKTAKVYIDSWNYLQLNVQETNVDTANNKSTVSAWLDLYVTSGGHVTSANVKTNITGKNETNHGYCSWGAGGYRIDEVTRNITHNNDGSYTLIVDAYFSGNIGTWSLRVTLPLTKINRAATINTFTNDGSITKAFRATYTTHASGYTYKLRISMPNIVALDTISNYASGTDVYLSDNSVKEIRRRTSAKTVQLGGVIETWSGSTKIGESSEIKITCNTRRPIHLRINSEWKEAYPYVRINGEWKEAAPHVRTNDSWKEGI